MRIPRFLLVLGLSLAILPAAAQQYGPNLPWADISGQTERQVVVAAGTPELYNGHPTTLLLDDRRTMLCTWSKGHGGPADFLAESPDGGLTWHQLPTPKEWKGLVNCPSLYKLTDKQGKQRIFVFAQIASDKTYREMGYSLSEDDGKTWSSIQPLGKLLHNHAGMDCGYPGLEMLPDGTLVATTYVKYHPGDEKHSVVSVRFKIEELDALFR